MSKENNRLEYQTYVGIGADGTWFTSDDRLAVMTYYQALN